MGINNSNSDNEDFKRNLTLSFGVHAAIISFFILKLVFFSEPKIDLSQAIRVDMVGLPDKLKPGELPPKIEKILKENPATPIPAQAEEKKSEPKAEKQKIKELPEKKVKTDDDAINLNKLKSKQKSALEKLKQQSELEKKKENKKNALDKIREQVRSEVYEKAKNEALQKQQQALLKGRVISAGTALTGVDKLQSDDYLSELDARIKSNWSLPQWLVNKPFKTRVLVKFNRDGRIILQNIILSSGNPTYDDYCLNAIKQSEPFPVVPEKFTDKYSIDGVIIGFPE